MRNETHVSAITVHTVNPIRVVSLPNMLCVDIRIDDLRVTVFHPTDDKTPEVLVQTETQATDWERLNHPHPGIKVSK